MNNPNGPYPGRQLFIGLTTDGNQAFAYLVTGRSPQSRERIATRRDNTVIMGPLGDVPYDPLRHYTAVEYDTASAILAVSNGIQTQAIFETYKLLYNVDTPPTAAYLKLIMEGAAFEPDFLHTPRIGAVITRRPEQPGWMLFVSAITDSGVALATGVEAENGVLTGVATYSGDLENPQPFDTGAALPRLTVSVRTAAELADYVYGISEATNNDQDIRVCAVGGVLKDNNWELALINAHQS